MYFLTKFKNKVKNEKGDVAIEYFVIAAVIIVGVAAALYALRDQLIAIIERITSIIAGTGG
jgi:Flp pilus assembly pilin Flp